MLPLVLLLLLSDRSRAGPACLALPIPVPVPSCLTGVPTGRLLLCLSPVLYAPRCPAVLPACESLPLPFSLSLSFSISPPTQCGGPRPADGGASCRFSPAPLSRLLSAAQAATSERPRTPPPLRPLALPRPLSSLPAPLLRGTAAVCLSLPVGLCGIMFLYRTTASTHPPSPARSRETKQPAGTNEEEARS